MPTSSVGSKRGLTLLELLVAMALAAMILAISFPSITAGLDGVRLQTSARRTGAFLNVARQRAERDQIPVEITIEPERGQMSALSADAAWDRTLELPDGVRLVSDDPERKPVRVVLLPGVPLPRLRLTLATTRGKSVAVEIDPLSGTPEVSEVR